MSLKDFQITDNETIDNSIMKRDFFRKHHQKGANLNDPDQNIEFILGENNNYHQIGNAYLQNDMTVTNHENNNFADGDVIRIMNNAFTYCFKEARLATTGGTNLEHNKYVGPI